jgi:glutaminyl-peptide cyclotransferase
MVRNYSKWLILGLGILFAGTYIMTLIPQCSSDNPSSSVVETKPLPDLNIPKFNADSAYSFTDKIVAFGPRIVGTEGAMKVQKYLVAQFKKYGADVMEQPFTATTYDGKKHAAFNIIARYNPTATNRIVLSAHWDSRPFADKDLDAADKNKPILGADDSGSAVGMLIEMGRQLQATPIPNLGVDIVLFDAEDYGDPTEAKTVEQQTAQELTWGIGAQYWSKTPHVAGYKALYGINLDMAGAKGARFVKEKISMTYASNVVEKVWRVAREKYGYTQLFSDELSRDGMTDDHVFVNQIAKIPMIDIINHPVDSYFGKYWHTTDDNMSVIDSETLRAVGQTLLGVLHYEANGAFK